MSEEKRKEKGGKMSRQNMKARDLVDRMLAKPMLDEATNRVHLVHEGKSYGHVDASVFYQKNGEENMSKMFGRIRFGLR